MGILAELKRRNVIRVSVAYLVLAWVVIQVADTVAPALNLPDWILSFVVWTGIIGFPFAVLIAWVFKLTPEGLIRDEGEQGSGDHSYGARPLNIAIVSLLCLALVLVIVDSYILTSSVIRDENQSEVHDSIAVLPFANMSGNESQEYFSDGLSEELLNLLARVEGLKVAARTSSFAFKGKNEDIRTIGEALGVGTVLEGSVRQAGERIRVTAQLIDVANGYHLWSDTFDRELKDIFEIQDQIAGAIVAALQVHLVTGAAPAIAQSRVVDIAAYDLYLQGLQKIKLMGTEVAREALELFRAATDADPEFAAAWSARARAVVLLRETAFWGDIPQAEAIVLARQAIDRALALDPSQADAYVSQAMLEADLYRHEEAMASLEKALAINPNSAEALFALSDLRARTGHIIQAREDILRALALDPLAERIAFRAIFSAVSYYEEAAYARIRSALSKRLQGEMDWMYRATWPSGTAEQFREMAADPEIARFFGFTKLNQTREVDESLLATDTRYPGESLMWTYMAIDQWDKAQAIYDALPHERKVAVINLEELSIMQAAQGQCQASIATLDRAHKGEVRVYGQVIPNMTRSNSNLALNRAFCLGQLGRDEESNQLLERVRTYVETLRSNTDCCYASIDAKLRVMDGDIDGAVEVLAAGIERGELSWSSAFDPVIRTLQAEPAFIALYQKVDDDIDAFRQELGMPALQE